MAIDTFNRSQFEDALPVHKQTGEKLWVSLGLVDGEYTYRVIVNEDIGIEVRSSIGRSGWSADTGEDSIRAWLVNSDNQPLGSKISKWTTRLPGWESRMTNVLRELWKRALKIKQCPDCNRPKGVYKVKINTCNKGRLFSKCPKCHGYFEWLEE